MSGLSAVADGRVVYRPDGAVLRGFMASDARVRVIRGPIRSGTSSACCQEIVRRGFEQAAGPDGVRRTRWFVVRNTYPDLKRSTIKTWLDWFPEEVFGRFTWSVPFRHVMRPRFAPDVWIEVEFLALDKPEDVNKLKSTEWTGGWINELQFIERAIFDEAESRCGQFPPLKDGGPTWTGLIADMNAPSEDHWLVQLTGEVPLPEEMGEDERRAYVWPAGWEYFIQPSALVEVRGADGKTVVGYELNPAAENLRWIPEVNGRPYYLETAKGKGRRWIDSNLMNRITAPLVGRPVFGEFNEEAHVAKQELRYNPNYPLLVGLDFGRRPAAVFGQQIGDRWFVLDELYAVDVGATIFAPQVKKFLQQRFPEALSGAMRADGEAAGMGAQSAGVLFWGDPKGQDKTQGDEATAYEIWAALGMRVRPAPVKQNSIETRIELVSQVLTRMREGMPCFLLSPRCRKARMAMGGGYHFEESSAKLGIYLPAKDRSGYSDVMDALQYMMAGGGEVSVMTGRARPGDVRPVQTFRRKSLRRAI